VVSDAQGARSFGLDGRPIRANAGPTLNDKVANWPTPAARDHKGSSEAAVTRVNGKSRMDLLDFRTEQGFSRPARSTAPPGRPSWPARQTWRQLRLYVTRTHGRATWRRLQASGGKRRLNPLFVEWLMAWPPGHSLCACSATEFTLWRQRMRFALSRLPMASGPWIWKAPADQTAEALSQIEMFAPADIVERAAAEARLHYWPAFYARTGCGPITKKARPKPSRSIPDPAN
jgi:hypothetical protein